LPHPVEYYIIDYAESFDMRALFAWQHCVIVCDCVCKTLWHYDTVCTRVVSCRLCNTRHAGGHWFQRVFIHLQKFQWKVWHFHISTTSELLPRQNDVWLRVHWTHKWTSSHHLWELWGGKWRRKVRTFTHPPTTL